MGSKKPTSRRQSMDAKSKDGGKKAAQMKKAVVESSEDSSDDSSSEEETKVKIVAKPAVGQKRSRAQSDVSVKGAKAAKTDNKKAVPAKKAASSDDSSDESSEEEAPKKAVPTKGAVVAKKAAPAKKAKDSSDESDSSSEDEAPKKPAAKAAPAKKAAAKKDSSDEDSSSEEEAPKKAVRKASNVSTGKKAAKKDSDEEDEEMEVAGGDNDAKELFVGNLAFATTEGSIRSAFSKFGRIANLKLPTGPDGRPKGFAFVEFATHAEAQKANDAMNGGDLDGRALRCNFSGGLQNGRPAGGAPGRGGDGAESSTLFVGNLGFNTNEDSLRTYFS
jgi:nucleolin